LLPQSTSTFNKVVVVNYLNNYGVLAYNSKGQSISGSNKVFKGWTSWRSPDQLTNIPNIGYCYKVATDQYLPIEYAQGSGFKG